MFPLVSGARPCGTGLPAQAFNPIVRGRDVILRLALGSVKTGELSPHPMSRWEGVLEKLKVPSDGPEEP